MNKIISPLTSAPFPRTGSSATAGPERVRKPYYDCQDRDQGLTLVIYVPGVDASGVEITTRGADLLVTARKRHFVRVNFESLNLEGAQLDYELKLRLGHGLDYSALEAEIHEGVLTLTIPQKQTIAFPSRLPLPCVA